MSRRRQARAALRIGDYKAAAEAFTALVVETPQDIDLYLQVARCYQQAEETQQAAAWYLKTAQLYVDKGIGVQAVALLRIYRELRPDDIETCRTMFRQCRMQTSEPEDLLDMLSENDQACYTMRYGEIFTALDDASFDALLDDMQVRELQDGDTLVSIGEPAESLFLIAEGAVQAWMVKRGERVSLGKIGAGGVCGEVPLFIGSRQRTGDLIACGATRIVEIRYALLKEVQQKDPAISQRIDALYHRHLLERQLALNPFFGALSASLRQQIAGEMIVVRVQKNGVIFNKGDSSLDVYLVRSGALAINIAMPGEQVQLKMVQGGSVIGETTIADNGTRAMTVQAASDAVLLRWSGSAYQACYQTHPAL
ncbi:MAG: cyclic nucleotide-binding domain-containing protein, partial [Mariprofundaceae bacterium]|nr:cyclic nucleotide-binding domain-containing protein [Mariprofundaceae bacterium]